jgi:para-aminobenzoate synthetase component I
MTREQFIAKLNEFGRNGIPFLFLIDFEFRKPIVLSKKELSTREILFDLNTFPNNPSNVGTAEPRILDKIPPSFQEYAERYSIVEKHLHYGDSYLTNLTMKTEITLNSSLKDIFYASKARYKLFFEDEFLVFSPECFVKIVDGRIYSYPMKGTIDASIPDAKTRILNDQKELAEHVTIVDLIRNDLSQVADNVRVTRFRYVEEIVTNAKNLLQVSSEIVGTLASDYTHQLGTILDKLLPAGSISGAPKAKTVSIIREAEKEDRGYYTGVFGYFDGNALDSGVMIRFIERRNEKFYYRSGAGITAQSDVKKEYKETIDKVYVPFA